MSISLIIMLFALACFVLSAVGISARVNLTALGLAFTALAFILNSALLY